VAGKADVADLAVLVSVLGFCEHANRDAASRCECFGLGAGERRRLEAVVFSAHQQNILCHLGASEVVGVHTKEPVDDLDRVVTINQVEGVVDDLPQSRYQARPGPHTPAHQPSAMQHRPDRAAHDCW
jgi:hypothetical protein